jgi:Zn-dependent protease
VGKIALSGPITNIVLSVGCILVAYVTQDLFWFVAFINAFLAVFNLIPFGIMDGLKVFKWNRKFWAIAFALGVALAVYTYGPALSSF